ncbi:MAG: BatA domain-containing protein, partial [bacterium]|nr:BatA domain-containing protein [bacterium]
MNLTFLNPLLLFGLAAAVLPILIHRITQKKANRRKFSALRLLLQSQSITAKPQRLKHLLLLALRILAVTTLVILMARPVVLRSEALAFLREGAKVVILDNSLSMGYREDRGERHALAKKAAREALAGFGGLVAVIPTVSVPGSTGFQWRKQSEALKFLEAMPLSYGRGNAASALARAYRGLADIKKDGEILVVSDMAKS